MEKEIWKDIEDYEGLYKVSNMGRVKSLKFGKERILKAFNNGNGYLQLFLWKDGKKKHYKIHRLVAQAFLENPYNLPEVNHKDENKQNNCADNLEFCDKVYNCNYGTRNQRVAEKLRGRKQSEEHIKKRAEKYTNNSKLSKPVIAIHKINGLILEFSSTHEASRQTGINQGNIVSCCNGKLKSAGGYQWQYL